MKLNQPSQVIENNFAIRIIIIIIAKAVINNIIVVKYYFIVIELFII